MVRWLYSSFKFSSHHYQAGFSHLSKESARWRLLGKTPLPPPPLNETFTILEFRLRNHPGMYFLLLCFVFLMGERWTVCEKVWACQRDSLEWRGGWLETEQPRPVSAESRWRTSGCHPCRQMSQAEVTTPHAVRVIKVHCIPFIVQKQKCCRMQQKASCINQWYGI